MSTVHEETQTTEQAAVDEILKVVDQLPTYELETFITQVLLLQARRRAPSLPHDESALMLKINEGLPEETRTRYYTLIDKRDEEALTSEEYEELLRLTEEAEGWNVKWLAALTELAQLRQMPLRDLMDSLGIRPPTRE